MTACRFIGKHRHLPDHLFNERELRMGIRIEMEHTHDQRLAKEIAKDHLVEIKDYYTRLVRMEREAEG